MRVAPILLTSLIFVAACNPARQQSFWNSPHACLDQPPPGDTPQRFAPKLLTDSGYFVLGRVAFTPDGKEFFYGNNDAWFSNRHQRLSYFRYDSASASWKGPTILAPQYSTPTFAMDGETLLVTGGPGIQRMHRTNGGWSTPEPWLDRSYELYNYMPTQSGRAYLGSNGTWGRPGDYNAWRFAVMPADPRDTSIRDLGQPLNSAGFNGDLYVAPDESYMIVSAKETKDFECELWISFRKPDSSWSQPQSLGPLINEGPAHRFGQYVSPDGKYLFYTKGTSEKDCGIYWVRWDDLLKKLRALAGL